MSLRYHLHITSLEHLDRCHSITPGDSLGRRKIIVQFHNAFVQSVVCQQQLNSISHKIFYDHTLRFLTPRYNLPTVQTHRCHLVVLQHQCVLSDPRLLLNQYYPCICMCSFQANSVYSNTLE